MKLLAQQSVDRYLGFCKLEKRLDSKTLKAYRGDLNQLSSWLGENTSPFNSESLHLYIVFLNSRYAVSSVKRKFTSLKAFANYLEENNLQDNPFRGFRLSIKDPRLLPKTISTEELNRLLKPSTGMRALTQKLLLGDFKLREIVSYLNC